MTSVDASLSSSLCQRKMDHRKELVELLLAIEICATQSAGYDAYQKLSDVMSNIRDLDTVLVQVAR